jgi:hypothetical protein
MLSALSHSCPPFKNLFLVERPFNSSSSFFIPRTQIQTHVQP